MFPFLMTGVVGALLASCCAFFGELYAAGSGWNRRLWAILGAWFGPFLGLLGILLALSNKLGPSGCDTFLFIAGAWGDHWLLVSLAATGGVYLAYKPRSANRSYWGVLLVCLVAIPLTCWHLALLMLV